MRKAGKVFKVLAISFICILFINPIHAFGASKEYYISNIDIKATVDDKGNMQVKETYKYNFTGSFNGIKRNIETNGSDGIENVKVNINDKEDVSQSDSENNNTYKLSESGNSEEVKIFSKSQDEEKVFNISYTVKNVVTKYKDLSELKWVFYKNEEDVKIDSINVYITLPKGITGEVSFNGEGPNRGVAENSDNKFIKLSLSDMGKNEVIGAAIHFPVAWVNTSKIIDKNYDEYMNESLKEKNKTNIAIMVAITLGMILIGGSIYAVSNKRKKEIAKYREDYIFFNGNHYEDIPADITPALVTVLLDDRLEMKDFLASILYLANKGFIKFEEKIDEDNYEEVAFNLVNGVDKSYLLKSEKYLLYWLNKLSENGRVDFSTLMEDAGEKSFRDRYNEWVSRVNEDAYDLNMYVHLAGKDRLTNEYENERLKWKAFKRYLVDLDDKEGLKKLDVWQRILPYAISLEVFDNISEHIRKTPGYNDAYNPMYNYGFLYFYSMSYQDNFNDQFSQSAPNTSSSSSFTGGDGGGFGGGGGSSAF
ncbi:DUF2207 domain-containing protein [Clostridium paridis]|uniref:DUF2207 domain-containing protein n=1 Tax=Clostridium paridis TaxID=2803863 RepID=A0A937FKJ7_9CLOT|nr:DUF2207 domain-containing protein [Clostridium paridis]MBL4933636.1 DUF2207 domain-containing protein [Clostridium paridis]